MASDPRMIRYVTQLRAMPLSVTTQRSAYPFLNAANAAKIATASASAPNTRLKMPNVFIVPFRLNVWISAE